MVLDQIPHTPVMHHVALDATFTGTEHALSTCETPIYQFRGIKYATIPARFRQSKLLASYPSEVDATKNGPICPQMKYKTVEEELFGLAQDDVPRQTFKQSEFECLNLNITCPGNLTPDSHVPVMLWVHGGGERGSGSNWIYDGGPLVQQSMLIGKPIILVTFNYRLGLFGSAASSIIREDNKAAGDDGVGNYGLRDQRKALEWVHHFIGEFGGDPSNVTFFGESTGAADIVAQLLSTLNESRPLFQRAIIQSPILDHNLPDVNAAGWHLSRIMSALGVSTLEQLRAVEPDKLALFGQNLRGTDDGVFLRKDWKQSILPEDSHHHHHRVADRNRLAAVRKRSHSRSPRRPLQHPQMRLVPPSHLQPLIIGDCSSDSLLWSLPVSLWTSAGVVRRLHAVCQCLSKASAILRAYDVSSSTPHEELVEHVLDLVNDARVAWPIECVVNAAKREGAGVWRYIFDQAGPSRGVPHHAADLMYLFDNVPLPSASSASPEDFYDASFDSFDELESDVDVAVDFVSGSPLSENVQSSDTISIDSDDQWLIPSVDEWSYRRVRDAIQGRWIAFAHGEAPWADDKVFVFGPEGETGERSASIFEGRRRKSVWKDVLEPLGMPLVQKIGFELSNGPPMAPSKAKY